MELSPQDVDAALAGRRDATRRLVDGLTPVVQARVARILLRRRRAGRDIRQDVQDLVQDVFVALFADAGRVLRAWDQRRGMSLRNFVGLVAERLALSRLRTHKRNPWTEEPVDGLDVRQSAGDPPEVEVASRELVRTLADRLREELTPLAMHLFRLLFIEERSVADVCATMHMGPDAVYAWRSRIGKRLRRIAHDIGSEQTTWEQTPKRGRR